jgi:hypothetical protein
MCPQSPGGAGLHKIQEGHKDSVAATQQPTKQAIYKFKNQQMINKLK